MKIMVNLTTELYNNTNKAKEDLIINITPIRKKLCTYGPVGLGSKDPNVAVKFSLAAKFLEHLFINNSENKKMFTVINGETNKLLYFNKDNFVICNENYIRYYLKDNELQNYVYIYSYIAFCVLENKNLNDFFEKIKDEYSKNNCLSIVTVLKFCDLIKNYIIAKDNIEVSNDLTIEEICNAFRKQEFYSDIHNPFENINSIKVHFFDQVDNKITIVNNTKNKELFNYENLKKGKYNIKYDWNDKLSIPQLCTLDDYIPNEKFIAAFNKINYRLKKVKERIDSGITNNIEVISKDYINFMIVGKPGTGKTVSAYALGATFNMPTYSINCSRFTEEDKFEGMNKVVDGKISFVPTEFLKAYENGGIIILEEINLLDPGVIMGAIGQALVFPFTLMKDGYIPIKRHPLCVIIGTMNVGTNGSREMNEALSSRFKQTYMLNDPNKEDFIEILMKQGFDKIKSTWTYNAYNRIINFLSSPNMNKKDYCLRLTTRGCIGALENMDEGDNPKDAIINSLVGKIAEIDLETAQQIITNVISSLKDI